MARYQSKTNNLCSVGHRSAGFVVSSAEVDPIPALFVKATGGRNRRINLCSGDARIMQSHGPRATAQDSTFMIFRGLSAGLRRTFRCGGVFGGTEEDGGNVRMPHYPGRVRGISIRVKLRHNIFHDLPAPIFSDIYRAGKSGQPIFRSPLFRRDWSLRRAIRCGGGSGGRKSLTTSISEVQSESSSPEPYVPVAGYQAYPVPVHPSATICTAGCSPCTGSALPGTAYHIPVSETKQSLNPCIALSLMPATATPFAGGFSIHPVRGSTEDQTEISSPESSAPVAGVSSAYPDRELPASIRMAGRSICTGCGLPGTAYHMTASDIGQTPNPCVSLSLTPASATPFAGVLHNLHTGCVSINGSSAFLQRTVVTREDETVAPFPELDCPATNPRHTLRVIQSFSEMKSLPSPNACVQGLYVHYFERIIKQMRRFKSIDLVAHELPIRYIFRSEMDITDFYAEEYFLDRVTYIDDNSFAIEVTGMTDNPDNYTPETIEAARIERAPGTEKRFVVDRETVAEPPYIYLLGFYELMRLLERTAELCDGGCLAANMQPIYDDDSEYAELMSDLDRIGHEIMEEKRFPNPVISNPPA